MVTIFKVRIKAIHVSFRVIEKKTNSVMHKIKKIVKQRNCLKNSHVLFSFIYLFLHSCILLLLWWLVKIENHNSFIL